MPLPHFGQLADAMQDGHASIKIFTTDIRPGNVGRMVPHGHIWEALKVVAAAGGIACIHAEDNDIVMFMYEKLMRENRVGFEHMAEVHNTLSEELSFNRVIRLAERVEGAALYMVHVSAATGVAALEASRNRGFPMYGETLHQYLLYNAEDYKRPGGQMYHTYPSLKYPEDQKRLWEATNRGAIQAIATDELCCPLRVKLQGSRIDDTTGGNSGVEPRVALMYTHMVAKRGYSPAHFVDMVSSNAARIMGLYPRKGALAVGSDADIVVLQTGIERTIRAAELHETDYTPWEGHVVTAWPADHLARQDRRAGRRLPWRPQARPVPQAQGGRGDPQPAGPVMAAASRARPKVAFIGTGGTIASLGIHPLELQDYVVHDDRMHASAIVARFPEVEELAEVIPVDFRNVPSTEIHFPEWKDLAALCRELVVAHRDLAGIVIGHGTASLEETAYVLNLVLKVPVPVVLTGAQRPASGLSTDAAINLVNGVRTAASPDSRGRGVLVVLNDEIQAAREVTKTSNWRMQTFRTPDFGVLGHADADRIAFYRKPERRHMPDTEFDLAGLEDLPRVDIAYAYPGSDGTAVRAFVAAGAKGLVSAGFAPGMAPPADFAAMAEAVKQGVVVVQSSRAGSGRIHRGKKLADAGILAADNLNPQKARILLALALTRTSDPGEIARMFATY